jgi:(p)ppGpp synthase/HD superfamily hydrolase
MLDKKKKKKVLRKKLKNCQNCQKIVKKLSKSCQKFVIKLSKNLSKFDKIGDNCISIKSRWGWRQGQKVIPRPLADYLGVGQSQKLQILK